MTLLSAFNLVRLETAFAWIFRPIRSFQHMLTCSEQCTFMSHESCVFRRFTHYKTFLLCNSYQVYSSSFFKEMQYPPFDLCLTVAFEIFSLNSGTLSINCTFAFSTTNRNEDSVYSWNSVIVVLNLCDPYNAAFTIFEPVNLININSVMSSQQQATHERETHFTAFFSSDHAYLSIARREIAAAALSPARPLLSSFGCTLIRKPSWKLASYRSIVCQRNFATLSRQVVFVSVIIASFT